MKKATISFLLKDDMMYLAEKLSRLGAGNLNGYGGKVEGDETPEAAAVRELNEECGVTVYEKDLDKRAVVEFYEGDNPIFECHIYFVKNWQGEPQGSEEMGKPALFPLSDMPYERMWAGDRSWLALVIEGKKIRAKNYYAMGNKTVVKFEYEEVLEF